MKTLTLNNGVKCPVLGFGTFPIKNTQKCVEQALECGYKLIDTAQKYANEKDIGAALKVAFGGGVKRQDIFIQSKVWISHADEKSALKAFEMSLKNLGLDYLDAYMLHYPYNDIYGAWRTMSKLYEKGLVKALGVSNFYPDKLGDLCIFNEIKPALNQLELHPFYQRKSELNFNHNLNIAVQAWSPFGQGKNSVFANKTLQKIAQKHQKSVGQVILRWHIEQNILVIPKSTDESRMRENLAVFDFALDAADKAEIHALDANKTLFLELFGYERIKWLEGFKSLNSVNFNAANADKFTNKITAKTLASEFNPALNFAENGGGGELSLKNLNSLKNSNPIKNPNPTKNATYLKRVNSLKFLAFLTLFQAQTPQKFTQIRVNLLARIFTLFFTAAIFSTQKPLQKRIFREAVNFSLQTQILIQIQISKFQPYLVFLALLQLQILKRKQNATL